MKRGLLILSFLMAFACLPSAQAANSVGEGYALPTFRELTQTAILFGGLDINDAKVSDEYARLMYCDLYLKNFKDDLVWHRVKGQLVSRVLEKKEYFRVLYETVNVFKLGRYDVEKEIFPITPDTAFENVGSLRLLSYLEAQAYCDVERRKSYFPPNIFLLLDKPLTVNSMNYPMQEVDQLVARMTEAGNATDRRVYGRIRFRVLDAAGVTRGEGAAARTQLRGNIMAVDFFLDPELSKPIGSVKIGR